MHVAAHVAAWGKRWPATLPGPLPAASPVAGVSFEIADLLALWPNARLIVEAAFGADLTADPNGWNWYDITIDVRQADGQKISITPIGRADEASTTQPAGCAFELANDSGDYTAYNATGVHYPYVRRNTPIRVTVNLTGVHADDSIRFQGYANGFEPSWDMSANLAIVKVSASGVLRRIQQGKSPLRSAAVRATLKMNPVAFWAFEDASTATQASSALADSNVLTVGSGATVTWANDSTLAGAAALPQLMNGATTPWPWTPAVLTGDARGRSDSVWSYSAWWRATMATPATGRVFKLMRWGLEPGGVFVPDYQWNFYLYNDPSFKYGVAVNGSGYVLTNSGPSPFDGSWHHAVITAAQEGSQIRIKLYVDGTLLQSSLTSDPLTLQRVRDIQILPSSGMVVPEATSLWGGPNAVFDRELTAAEVLNLYNAGLGYVGETATARLVRLFDEEGIPLDLTGTSDTTMGAQGIDKFINLVRECETADHGMLFDGRGPGCGYIARSALYNQTAALTVDGSSQLAAQPAPADNDQRNRNLVKASRKNGGSATVEDETGTLGTNTIGVYDTSITVNIDSDTKLADHAGWLVHQGTVDGFRYPTLPLDLAATPVLAAAWLRTRLLNRVDVTGIAAAAPQHPAGDVSLLFEGWAEQLSPFDWEVAGNCSPNSPWVVGVLDTTGYLDCGASTLAVPIDPTQTSISVAVNDICFWTHADGDYVIVIDGEEMTVTAVGAATSPQTLTVTRSVNGVVKAHSADVEVHVRDAFVLAL